MSDSATGETSQGKILFAEPRVIMAKEASGTIYLRSPYDLPKPSRCIGSWIERWADERPDKIFLADKFTPDGLWQKITYRQTLGRIYDIAGWLLATGASPDRPIAILSENSIDHALLAFAGMHVGIPVATISSAYSILSQDHATLKAMIGLLDPGIIFVSDFATYGKAVAAIEDEHNAQLVCSSCPPQSSAKTTVLQDAAKPENRDKVAQAFAAITPDMTARLLFTSGSTGTPKAVINTHLMLTSNQEANLAVWPFLQDSPPVLVDWLPWSHTFGANFCMNMVLRNGGTMYIDDGKPAPPLIHKTVENIKEIRPSMCFNVPRGFDMLLPELENDPEFCKIFFNVDLIFYAAAALPKTTWDKLIAMSNKTRGSTTPLVAAWGSTETAPLATHCHFQAETSGNIGVPVPGTELKLIPNADKLEVRARGPNITPGYYKYDEKTRESFDEEGFYIMGDAVRFADNDDPAKGLFFDGRVSEDFKLTSGTWVSVGELRIAGIDALTPIARDIVVTGHNQDEIGFLVFPNDVACRKIADAGNEIPIDAVLSDERVIKQVREGMAALMQSGGGSSRYAARVRLLATPPNPDSGEITDKAYLNQRRILANRKKEVARLHGDDPSAYIALQQ